MIKSSDLTKIKYHINPYYVEAVEVETMDEGGVFVTAYMRSGSRILLDNFDNEEDAQNYVKTICEQVDASNRRVRYLRVEES